MPKPRTTQRRTAATAKTTVSRTDDGVPIANATLAQIRKGGGKAHAGQLVRVPQLAERGRLYRRAAEVIGERESLALPYHGGRLWRCEVRVSDRCGAVGDNYHGGNSNNKGVKDKDAECTKKPKANYKDLTPLFRWYRGSLILATLPYILEDIVAVEDKAPGKKRWANGLSDDDELDSSDEEWSHERYTVAPTHHMTMDASALTASARADSRHPPPHVSRAWISPDLQRFGSRAAALTHSAALTQRDALIDRALYGYGVNGVRLRPAKPTRKVGLEAGRARFLRDGLWIVGQEELWIEKRRDVLVKKLEKKRLLQLQLQRSPEEGCDEGPAASEEEEEDDAPAAAGQPVSPWDIARRVHPALASKPAAASPRDDDATTVVSPAESDASTEGLHLPHNETDGGAKGKGTDSEGIEALALHPCTPRGLKSPPPFAPSTHYRLSPPQVDLCLAACLDHYQQVMDTVRARSLQLELLDDGFDVLRERGRGRYDMTLPALDAPPFAFLTCPRRAPWMPVVRALLGPGAALVHKGCFLSLPGSATQVYHQDGVHLNRKAHKPAHAINVFVPLVDLDLTNGPTEFCLGTHYLGHENFVKANVYTPCVTAGTPVIFDYRLGHRGLRNSSQGVRPVVYLTYSSVASGKEFRDSVNFSTKRYRKLGDFVEKPLSREERAQKRRRQEEEL